MQSHQNAPQMKAAPILALDIGGTFIKSGLVSPEGQLQTFPPVFVDNTAPADVLFDAFADVIRRGTAHTAVSGVGICIPGPFDFNNGISFMQHKFRALHGIDFLSALRTRIPVLKTCPVRLIHDANAFLLGEMRYGAGAGASCVGGVTIGTGIGAVLWRDRQLAVNSFGCPAAEIRLWDKPYLHGTVEDTISSRGIIAQYHESRPAFQASRGVKGIADEAAAGDNEALEVLRDFGRHLGSILAGWCERFHPEVLVIGGQIAQSRLLFEESLRKHFVYDKSEIRFSLLGASAPLLGIAHEMRVSER